VLIILQQALQWAQVGPAGILRHPVRPHLHVSGELLVREKLVLAGLDNTDLDPLTGVALNESIGILDHYHAHPLGVAGRWLGNRRVWEIAALVMDGGLF